MYSLSSLSLSLALYLSLFSPLELYLYLPLSSLGICSCYSIWSMESAPPDMWYVIFQQALYPIIGECKLKDHGLCGKDRGPQNRLMHLCVRERERERQWETETDRDRGREREREMYTWVSLSLSFIIKLFILLLSPSIFLLSLHNLFTISHFPCSLCLLFPLSHLGIWTHYS